MDQTGAAIVEAIEPYGLVPMLVVGLLTALFAVACVFVLPAWRDKMRADSETERMRAEATIRIEQEREARKADEARMRDERDRERAAIDSKTAVLLEGLKESIDALKSAQEVVTAQIESSRTSSRKMGDTVDDTNRKVTEMHHALIEGRYHA